MTFTFVLTVLVVWLLASLAAALVVAKLVRGKREPGPSEKTDVAGLEPSLKKTA